MIALVPLLVIAAIVVAVLVLRERRDDSVSDEGSDGHGTLRRVFVYSLALLGAVLTASGLSGVLRVALESMGATTLVRETGRELALGLSLAIVGVPIWLLAWRAAARDATRSIAEQRSVARRLYLAAVRAVALGIAIPYAIGVGRWVADVQSYDAAALARVIVWGGLWVAHERVAAGEVALGSEHTRRIDRVETYVAATAGFGLLAFSVGRVLAQSLAAVYERLAEVPVLLVEGVASETRSALVAAVVGAAVWVWHWLVVARRDRGSTGWFVYLFLVGVLSGTAAAITSGSVLLHRVLAWLLDAAEGTAGTHFAVAPSAFAGLVVGVAVWGYHRAVLREAEEVGLDRWSAPERAYRYIMTAAGMLTTAVGVATILMVGLDLAVAGRTLVDAPGGIRDVLAIGLTLLLIGVPLWARFWTVVQRRVREQPEERTELARRVLIFAAFGAAIVTTVVALSVLLFEVFDAAFAGTLTVDVVEEQRWSIALLVTAAAVSIHYGLVLREDRRETAGRGAAGARVRDVVVVAPPTEGLVADLRARLDAKVTLWERRDAAGLHAPGGVVDAVVDGLAEAAAARVLVVIEADGAVRVIPLER